MVNVLGWWLVALGVNCCAVERVKESTLATGHWPCLLSEPICFKINIQVFFYYARRPIPAAAECERFLQNDNIVMGP